MKTMSSPARVAAAALLAMLAAPCLAQTAAPADAQQGSPEEEPFFSGTIPVDPALAGTIRLSPEQREAALEAGATRTARGLDGGAPDHGIHGEMGVEVGTGGERAVYGTAVVPLGQTGTAAFSFEDGRSSNRWRRW